MNSFVSQNFQVNLLRKFHTFMFSLSAVQESIDRLLI